MPSEEPDIFAENAFNMANVNTKTFILMLAQAKPLSFVSGAPIDLALTLKESNRAEFHHLMPRAFLKATHADQDENVLANFCFLSRADNRTLGGVAPSEYRKKMPANTTAVLRQAICPESLFGDEYELFISDRSHMLADEAKRLIA